jgi:hypothetical protein
MEAISRRGRQWVFPIPRHHSLMSAIKPITCRLTITLFLASILHLGISHAKEIGTLDVTACGAKADGSDTTSNK